MLHVIRNVGYGWINSQSATPQGDKTDIQGYIDFVFCSVDDSWGYATDQNYYLFELATNALGTDTLPGPLTPAYNDLQKAIPGFQFLSLRVSESTWNGYGDAQSNIYSFRPNLVIVPSAPPDPTWAGVGVYFTKGDYFWTGNELWKNGEIISYILSSMDRVVVVEDNNNKVTGLKNSTVSNVASQKVVVQYSAAMKWYGVAQPTVIGSNTNFGACGTYTAAQSKQNFLDFINGDMFEVVDASEMGDGSDPYSESGQTAGEGGGRGDVDNVSEAVDIPDLPTISATDTGLVSLFAPTAMQLKSLASYLWSGAFDLDSFKKIFADPMDCILGLSLLPVAINSQTQRVLSVGNISTGIIMDFVESQYVKIDCGSLNINEYFGAYLDYSPYTKIEIYLPYIGIRPLAIDDVMNKTLQVVYHIDLLSGTCTAFLKADDSVIYSYIGQCSVEIPVTSVNYGNMITGALNIAGSIGSMVATGGMSAPMALGNIAATATNSLKPDVEKSGAYSGGGGLLGIQNPYVILTRPRAAIPANQNKYLGYPGFITKKVSNLSGYTEFEEIHLEGLTATENEMSELMNILKNGVIL